jgi:hypothetical protein
MATSSDCATNQKLTRVRLSSGSSYLERLGVLYAHPIRIKINSELYMREMSPTQALEEFGGGSYGQMLGHFKMLEKHGWLRWVRRERPAGGVGRPRNLYRATELAVVDDATWAELPASLQIAFTVRTLQHVGERIGGALAAGTVDASGQRSFSCQSVAIDDQGWCEAVAALAKCFHALEQEQLDAKIRLDKGGERGVLMTFALAGFEMPKPHSGDRTGQGINAAPLRLDLEVPLSTRMAKVFADLINLEIVKALHIDAMSPTQLHSMLGETSLWSIDRKCRMLTELGWLVKGEHHDDQRSVLYRATGPEVADADLWREVPTKASKAKSWPIFSEFCVKASTALREGSFNARTDRHLTSFTFLLDKRGRQQAALVLRQCEKDLRALGAAARSRAVEATQSRSAHPSYLATFLLAGFEDPIKKPHATSWLA